MRRLDVRFLGISLAVFLGLVVSFSVSAQITAVDVWSERVKGLLKAELKRRNVGYRELAEKLTAMGIPETERNIANKISRGGFTAAFFVQCLVAIGADVVRLADG